MPTPTPNLGLGRYVLGTHPGADALNANWTIIDSAIKALSDQISALSPKVERFRQIKYFIQPNYDGSIPSNLLKNGSAASDIVINADSTALVCDANGTRVRFTSAGGLSDQVYLNNSSNENCWSRLVRPIVVIRMRTGPSASDIEDVRFFMGINNGGGDPHYSGQKRAGFAFVPGTSPNWLAVTSDGTDVFADTGVLVEADTSYEFTIDQSQDGKIVYSINGAEVAVIETNLMPTDEAPRIMLHMITDIAEVKSWDGAEIVHITPEIV